MNRWTPIAAALLSIALSATGCGAGLDGSTSTSSSAALSSGSSCPDGSTLTYSNFGQAFMSRSCTSCHAGRSAPNLSTLAGIKANLALVDAEAAAGPTRTNTRMPEGSSVTLADRQKLGEWLACGAP